MRDRVLKVVHSLNSSSLTLNSLTDLISATIRIRLDSCFAQTFEVSATKAGSIPLRYQKVQFRIFRLFYGISSRTTNCSFPKFITIAYKTKK